MDSEFSSADFDCAGMCALREHASTPAGQFELVEIWRKHGVPESTRIVLITALFDRGVHADLLGPKQSRAALLAGTPMLRSRPRGIAMPLHAPRGVIPPGVLDAIAETEGWGQRDHDGGAT